MTNEGFVLLKGSQVRSATKESLRETIKTLRKLHADKIDKDGYLSENILLRSPNEAAQFVVGYPIYASTAWKTSNGVTLKDIESKEAAEDIMPIEK